GKKPQSDKPVNTGMASFDALSQKLGAYEIEPIFKNHLDDELGHFYKIKLPKITDLKKARAEFEKLDVIEKAAPNYLAKAAWTPPPDDTYYSSQWALPKINASSAWNVTQGSSDTVIAVIDSGVDTDHPDLASKIWVNTGEYGPTLDEGLVPNCTSRGLALDKSCNNLDDDGNTYFDDWRGWDFVANTGYGEYGPPCIDRNPGDPNLTADNDPNPEPTGLDEDECLFPGVDNGQHHGTSVAGIAAAITNNAEGIAGVCPNCSIMAPRVLDDEGWGSYVQIAAAIVYAGDKGADVINMSLAGPYDDTVIDVALHSAFADGSILVSAAGNGDIYGVGYDIDPVANKLSPICNDDYYFVDGGENEVIGVAATNQSDVKMSWSNYGKKYVDISAPGTSLHAPLNGGGYTSGFGGTSGATPIVSGVLGLVKSQHPTWDNKAVRDTTIDLIHNINAVNPSYAGRLGGRVDALRAIDVNERLNGSGTLIKDSGPAIYLLENGQRRYIPSPEIFFSHFRNWDYIAVISSSRLNDYPPGPDLLFRQGTLIKANNDSAVYQVEYPSATKRHITSADIFLGLDYDWDDIIGTTLELVSYHPTGNDINALGSHVSGALVKTNSAAEVYLLDSENGNKVKRHIINPTVFELYFRWQDIATISDLEMATYSSGSDFRFQDGTLLQGIGPAIYLISYGKKRHLTSTEGYFARGYNWNQYIVVSDEELTNYTTGEDLN
ncbi:MAG: S8 family serine peptidase, partial [Candidatus Berkelbacteria bacterium]|nr:S8 family serine peptidase [Candidatus Berkelbacteria bacterium]